ncbi:MAG: hypothetical protein HRU01_12495 [Myxococcales bacterium]|nr:hypothetical protein [Myxococcales bacterium]
MGESIREERAAWRVRARVLHALLCAIALTLIACGGETEAPDTREPLAPKAAPSAKRGGAPEERAEADQQAGRSAAVPDDVEIPADLPTYPGARITAASHSGPGLSITYETRDSPSTVATSLEDSLRAEDWVVQRADQGGTHALFADKGVRALSIVIESKDGKTQISVLAVALE